MLAGWSFFCERIFNHLISHAVPNRLGDCSTAIPKHLFFTSLLFSTCDLFISNNLHTLLSLQSKKLRAFAPKAPARVQWPMGYPGNRLSSRVPTCGSNLERRRTSPTQPFRFRCFPNAFINKKKEILTVSVSDIRIKMPNLLLIAGNGRNVGKTYLACRLIASFSKKTPVTAVKVTPHFHPFQKEDVIVEKEDFIILKERNFNHKDSSLMLKAGADQVFFVMAKRNSDREAFADLQKLLPQHLIICESGGLHKVVEPGLFLFVNSVGRELKKEQHLQYDHLLVTNDGKEFSPGLEKIQFDGQRFTFRDEQI